VTITASNPRWVIDEDYALKEKLSGFTVNNYPDGVPKKVAVYFRFPDPEERQRTFPHIAIDLVEINFDPERAHRSAGFNLPYDLEQATPLTLFGLVADDYPLPWSLIYQLSAYSRQPWQDRQLSLMLYQMFPEQYGSLDMSAFDGTVRRADLVSVTRRDTVDDNKKRTYRQIFTIAVSSEFFLNQIVAVQKATRINITVIPYIGQVPQ
jgi:hypothetical protein